MTDSDERQQQKMQPGDYVTGYLSQSEYDAVAESAKEKGGVIDATGESVCDSTTNRQRGGNQ